MVVDFLLVIHLNSHFLQVMQNAEPPNQLALRMHVNVGSYQEEDDQRGLAHFLEHMVGN